MNTNNKIKRHWKTGVIVPENALFAFENIFEIKSSAVLMSEIEEGENEGKWLIEAITPEKPDVEKVKLAVSLASEVAKILEPEISIDSFADVDWLKESLVSFAPVIAERFFVHGSHFKDKKPISKIPIIIDAATAFGSGEHHTTKGCLLALCQLAKKRKFKKILDMGCGSGILSFAAAKLWNAKIDAVDNDVEAVRVTRQSAGINKVKSKIKPLLGNGYSKMPVCHKRNYDLIIANILAKPLSLMAKDLKKSLAPNGIAILSGLLENQENWVAWAHSINGLKIYGKIRINGWSTIIITRGYLKK